MTDLKMTLVSLLALASVAFLGQANHVSLRGIDSNIHAKVSMNVTSGGLKPVLPMPSSVTSATLQPEFKAGSSDYFNDHPFPLFWLNGQVMRLLGPDAYSARVLTAAFAVGSVFLTYLLGAFLYSEVYGVLAALFLIFTRDFILTSGTFSLDTALVFFILLTFYLWLKKHWWALGVFAGIGLWAKTPIVLLVFPTAFLVNAILGTKVFRAEFGRLLGAACLGLAVGSLVWVYTGLAGGWPVVEDYWVRQLWGTAIGGRGEAADRSPAFFIYTVRTGFLPGLPFLLFGLFRIYRTRVWRKLYVIVPFSATVCVGTVVTLMSFKLGHYYTPIFPFLALLAAYSVVNWVEKRRTGFYKAIQLGSTVLFCFLVVTPVELAPEAFVALTKFESFIQAHGSCEDTVVLVPGEEPVGSSLDYGLHLEFYTGRKVKVIECAELEKALVSQPYSWIVLGEQNLNHCLSPSTQKSFRGKLKMGTQLLLSPYLDPTQTDLTPLVAERQAVTDCKAPTYPQDRWHRYSVSTGQEKRSPSGIPGVGPLKSLEKQKVKVSSVVVPEPTPPSARELIAALERATEQLKEYSVIHFQRERFGASLGPRIKMKLKYSKGRVYLRMLEGPKQGAELLYLPKISSEKVKAHKGSFPDITVNLSTRNSRLLEWQHHTVETSAFPSIVKLVSQGAHECGDLPGATAKVLPEEPGSSRGAYRIELRSPTLESKVAIGKDEDIWQFAKRNRSDPFLIIYTNGIESFDDFPAEGELVVPRCYAGRTVMEIDKKTHLLSSLEIYDKDGHLYEVYRWENLDLSPLTELDFSSDNPEYDF